VAAASAVPPPARCTGQPGTELEADLTCGSNRRLRQLTPAAEPAAAHCAHCLSAAVPQCRSFALVNGVRVLLSCGFIPLVFAAFSRRDFSRPSILQRYL